LPDWLPGYADWSARYVSPADRMRLVIDIARENVMRGTGGPFGAAVFRVDDGVLVAVGVNSVVRLGNAILHAEIMALMLAQARVGSYTLAAPGLPAHELVTSCEPCAMCLGALPWSGIRHIVMGAAREDATRLGFDEGPVFPESYAHLAERGITVTRGVLRATAQAVLKLYAARGGPIYNG
jgi:tRNA(Arg) A34 adenosine deaminase TadA